MLLSIWWEVNVSVFDLVVDVIIMLFGCAAAYMTGRAVAMAWKP